MPRIRKSETKFLRSGRANVGESVPKRAAEAGRHGVWNRHRCAASRYLRKIRQVDHEQMLTTEHETSTSLIFDAGTPCFQEKTQRKGRQRTRLRSFEWAIRSAAPPWDQLSRPARPECNTRRARPE